MKPRSGLLRTKEFLMKDLYTFDASVEHAEKSYQLIRNAYSKIFDRLEVPYVKGQLTTNHFHQQINILVISHSSRRLRIDGRNYERGISLSCQSW
jgi:hypothetical protein